MKEILMSFRPEELKSVLSGEATINIRKSKPKLSAPFKVYLYETRGKTKWCNKCEEKNNCYAFSRGKACFEGRGKVVGEFMCDGFEYYTSNCTASESVLLPSLEDLKEMGLTLEEFNNYGTRGKLLYGWHISDLIVYDKPKELSEFKRVETFARKMRQGFFGKDPCCVEDYQIISPPQSWCYVEKKGA